MGADLSGQLLDPRGTENEGVAEDDYPELSAGDNGVSAEEIAKLDPTSSRPRSGITEEQYDSLSALP